MFISTGDQQFLMISMLMNWRVTRGRTLFKAHSLAPHEARARPRFTVRNEFSVENKDEHERRKTSEIRQKYVPRARARCTVSIGLMYNPLST
jgi:hypothetical protein